MAAWTDYGKQQLFAVGIGAIDAPQLYLALYEGSADPSGPPVELTLVGYGRAALDFALLVTDQASNQGDAVLGPMAVGSYTGLAVLDDPVADESQIWFWDDEGAPVTIPADTTVTFAAGELVAERTA